MGGCGGGHLMGPLSSRQLRPAAEAALVSVRDLATDQSALLHLTSIMTVDSFNCKLLSLHCDSQLFAIASAEAAPKLQAPGEPTSLSYPVSKIEKSAHQ